MTTVLVVYGSRHGGTRGIAERIGQTLRREGLDVDVVSADHVTDVGAADAFVVGSGIYMGSWLKEPLDFVRRNQATLAITTDLVLQQRATSRLDVREERRLPRGCARTGEWPRQRRPQEGRPTVRRDPRQGESHLRGRVRPPRPAAVVVRTAHPDDARLEGHPAPRRFPRLGRHRSLGARDRGVDRDRADVGLSPGRLSPRTNSSGRRWQPHGDDVALPLDRHSTRDSGSRFSRQAVGTDAREEGCVPARVPRSHRLLVAGCRRRDAPAGPSSISLPRSVSRRSPPGIQDEEAAVVEVASKGAGDEAASASRHGRTGIRETCRGRRGAAVDPGCAPGKRSTAWRAGRAIATPPYIGRPRRRPRPPTANAMPVPTTRVAAGAARLG